MIFDLLPLLVYYEDEKITTIIRENGNYVVIESGETVSKKNLFKYLCIKNDIYLQNEHYFYYKRYGKKMYSFDIDNNKDIYTTSLLLYLKPNKELSKLCEDFIKEIFFKY